MGNANRTATPASGATRREFLRLGAGVAAGLIATEKLGRSAPKDASRPNVLIIHTDQLSSWAVSSYAPQRVGTPNYGQVLVRTPHIDRIGREGARLTEFFTNSAVCTPSRGCMLTGRYPHCHGAYRNNIELNRDEVTLGLALKRQGYDTGYSGKWHLDGRPKPGFMTPDRAMGFDDCRCMFNRGHWKRILEDADGAPSVGTYRDIGDEKTYTTDYLAAKAIEFVTRRRAKPFCYVVSFPDPHTPFTVRAPYDTVHRPEYMPVPRTFVPGLRPRGRGRAIGEAELRRRKAAYCGLVKCIDDSVGRILAALERTGQLDGTVVVFTTDHGEYMGEHGLWGKNQWYRTAYQVPFLVRWPRQIASGTVVTNTVTMVDVLPTLLGLMGAPRTGREQGLDASGLLRGRRVAWTDEAQIHHSSLVSAGLFTPAYELVLKQSGKHMLFDRKNDPEQTRNLAHDAAHRETMAAMARKVVDHHRDLKSPAVKWLDAVELTRS